MSFSFDLSTPPHEALMPEGQIPLAMAEVPEAQIVAIETKRVVMSKEENAPTGWVVQGALEWAIF